MAQINSNMSGVVLRVLVAVGDTVSVDQDVIALESMKMEMMVSSSFAGKVTEIHVNPDDFVQEGQLLLSLA